MPNKYSPLKEEANVCIQKGYVNIRIFFKFSESAGKFILLKTV